MTGDSVWTAIGWTFLHVGWLGLIVGLVAAALRRALWGARPEARHAAALACLLALAATPFVVFAIVHRPAATVATRAVAQPSIGVNIFSSETNMVPPSPPPLIVQPAPTTAPRAAWFEPIVAILPGVWLAGSLLTLGSLATGLIGVERLRRSSVPMESGPIVERCRALTGSLGIVRKVGVAVCDRIAAPLLIGVARPLILLPSSALTGWSADQIEMALLHELAHLQRRDNLVILAQRFVESLLFFHPAAWWLSAWVRLERESCCDRLVVDRVGRPREYARWLAELAGCEPGRRSLASALNERPLTTRIRLILNMEDRSMKPTLPEVLALCAAGVLGAALTLPSLADSPDAKPDDARAALARLSASAGATPSDGDNQRNQTLLSIANAQIKLGDRAGALATLNRAELPTLPSREVKMDESVMERVEGVLQFAVARHKAGDAEAARAEFRRFAEYLGPPEAVASGETLALFEREFNASVVGKIDRLNQQADAAKSFKDADKMVQVVESEDTQILMWKLEGLQFAITSLTELGEAAEARSMIDLAIKSLGPLQGPLKVATLAWLGGELTRIGDVERGRAMLEQVRASALDMPEGPARDFALGGLAISRVKVGDIDDAVSLLSKMSPGARLRFMRDVFETLSHDGGAFNWLDSGGVKITIGSPWILPNDKEAARAALPKLAEVIRASGSAKLQGRTLATMAHLQARADDFAGAMATAESIPDIKRADYPGPSDGFYEAVKPATFALVAAARAEAGDQTGATAAFARSRALTGQVEPEDQKLIAQVVLSDKLATSGRADEARAVLAEAFPLAAGQLEPRRSRVLCMLVENQIKLGDLTDAAGNIEPIRDQPGVQKARALQSLASALREKGDAEGAAKAARRGIDCLARTPKPIKPGENPGQPGGIARDTFLDFDQESHPVLTQLYLQTTLPRLRILAGEREELAREATTLNPFQRNNVLQSVLFDTTRREELERAVEQVEALEAPDARLASIRSLVSEIEQGALTK